MQNHAAPKNMCKKTRKTFAGQNSLGGGYLAAPQTFTTPPEKKEKKLCRNEHTCMHSFNRSGQREKKVVAAGHESTTYKQTN